MPRATRTSIAACETPTQSISLRKHVRALASSSLQPVPDVFLSGPPLGATVVHRTPEGEHADRQTHDGAPRKHLQPKTQPPKTQPPKTQQPKTQQPKTQQRSSFEVQGDLARKSDASENADLWLRARNGDQDAFCILAERLHARLVCQARRFLRRDEEEAFDVVQDALLAAWEQRASITNFIHFHRWLFLVVRRHAISRLRRKTHAGKIILQLLDEEGHNIPVEAGAHLQEVDSALTPTERIHRRDERQLVALLRECTQQLAPIHATVLQLHHLHRMSTEEIANLLQVGRTAVKMRLLRARKHLRELIVAMAENELGRPLKATPNSRRMSSDIKGTPSSESPRRGDSNNAPCRVPGWAGLVCEWLEDFHDSGASKKGASR